MSEPLSPHLYIPLKPVASKDEVLASLWKALSGCVYGSDDESLILFAIEERERDLRNDRLQLPRRKEDGSRVCM